jgi:predicted metal-dependent hydrolase
VAYFSTKSAPTWTLLIARATVAPLAALSESDRLRLERGRAAFNRGEYFQAHELWEDAWRELDGVERILVQGLIQIAAGLHHLQQDRPRPAAGLLRKGLDKVSQGAFAPPVDLQVDALVRDVARLLAELKAASGDRLPPPQLTKL